MKIRHRMTDLRKCVSVVAGNGQPVKGDHVRAQQLVQLLLAVAVKSSAAAAGLRRTELST